MDDATWRKIAELCAGTDSLTIGTAARGAIRVTGSFDRPEEFERKIARALLVLATAKTRYEEVQLSR